MALTFALIAPVQSVLYRVYCHNETIPNAPKHYETRQNFNFGSMGWIECARCEKSWRNFMAQTFAFMAPIQPILHRVSCSNEMVPNAPKHYETQQNMSLGVQWGTSSAFVAKIRTRLHGMNFCINCTNSAYFAPSFMQ